jgi:hypothetical protein
MHIPCKTFLYQENSLDKPKPSVINDFVLDLVQILLQCPQHQLGGLFGLPESCCREMSTA